MLTGIAFERDPWQRLRTTILLLLFYFITTGHSQSSTSYSLLPPAPSYSSGAFIAPDGPTQVFTEGAHLNITWDAVFNPVNLYLIRGQDFNRPIGIQLNYYNTYYYWQIDGGGDLSRPFVFRIVRANGTEEQQELYGFLSQSFWIAPGSGAEPTGTLSSTFLRSATSPVATASGTGAKSASTGSSGLSSGAEIGIGVGCGIGVAVALIAGAAFFFWRRKKNNRQKESITQPPRYQPAAAMPGQAKYGGPPPMSYNSPTRYRDDYNSPQSSSYQPWSSTAAGTTARSQSAYTYEMSPNDLRSPVEAPGGWMQEPQELQAERYSKSGSPPPMSRSPPPIQPWDGRDAGP